MGFLKDKSTADYDAFTSLADETLAFYGEVVGFVEGPELGELVRSAAEEQSSLLEAIKTSRRARDDLPQAGDPERSRLQAVLAEARAFFAGDEGDKQLGANVHRATVELRSRVTQLLSCDLPDDELELLERYRLACESLERRLAENTAWTG